jgi:hypothetical protein
LAPVHRPRWKLLVEGLGKIERAEVEVHPLMLFVGDNNSGKSYLVSVLWGLLALQGSLRLPPGPTLSACEAWLDARRAEPDPHAVYELSDDDRALFTRLFNALIRHDDALTSWVFNAPTVTAARIEVDPAHGRAVKIVRRLVPGDAGVNLTGIDPLPSVPTSYEQMSGYRAMILESLASEVALGRADPGVPIFLPASRSGFMLLYQTAARRGFEQAVLSGTANGLKMTRPVYQFIDLLAFGLKKQSGGHAAEADLLESGLDGRVELISGPVGINEYAYAPRGATSDLHLSLASSLVTELAPIILVLRHLRDFPILVLEEPEAHLHPKLQRRLAQVVVRLVRKGLYVWITTHSESFCQQINNFMKIGAARDRSRLRDEMQKKLGYAYGPDDHLTPDEVAGYELVNQGDRSVARELKKHPDGLVMPTFNQEMVALSREVTFLEDQLDEGS